jgi:hypothetical protein
MQNSMNTIDKEFSSLLKKEVEDVRLSASFTEKIMEEVQTKKQFHCAPLISKKGWWVILSYFVVMVVLTALNGADADSLQLVESLKMDYLMEISTMPLIGLSVILLFISCDFYFRSSIIRRERPK